MKNVGLKGSVSGVEAVLHISILADFAAKVNDIT